MPLRSHPSLFSHSSSAGSFPSTFVFSEASPPKKTWRYAPLISRQDLTLLHLGLALCMPLLCICPGPILTLCSPCSETALSHRGFHERLVAETQEDSLAQSPFPCLDTTLVSPPTSWLLSLYLVSLPPVPCYFFLFANSIACHLKFVFYNNFVHFPTSLLTKFILLLAAS